MKETKKYPPVLYTVWQDAWTSITSPRQYLQWAFQPIWRSLRYFFFLQAIMSVVVTISLFFQVQPLLTGFQAWAESELPTLRFEDNELTTENDETLLFSDSDAFFFKLDTTQSLEEDPKVDVFYESGALLVRDGVVLSRLGEQTTYKYDEFGLENFTLSPEVIPGFIQGLKLFLFTGMPFLIFLFLVITRLVMAALFSLLAILLNGFKLKFKQVFSLALYAMTPAMLIGYLSVVLLSISSVFSLIFVFYFLFAVHYLKQFTGMRISKK